MDPTRITQSAVKSIALTLPGVQQHTVNGYAVLRRLIKILGLVGVRIRINSVEGRPLIQELIGQVELMLVSPPAGLGRDGTVATRELIAKIRATPRRKLTRDIADYISNPQVFRAIQNRMAGDGLIDSIVFFTHGSEDRIRGLLNALVERGRLMGVNDQIHQFGDLAAVADGAAAEAAIGPEEKGPPDPVLEAADEQRRLARLAAAADPAAGLRPDEALPRLRRAVAAAAGLRPDEVAEPRPAAAAPLDPAAALEPAPKPEELSQSEAAQARADALPTGTAAAAGARGAGQLGALGGEPLQPDEEKKSNVPEQAVNPQQNIEAAGAGVDQGRGLVQAADIGQEGKYDSVNNALANQLGVDNNQGFNQQLSLPPIRAPPAGVPETKQQLFAMLTGAVQNVDRLIAVEEPPSWGEIASIFEPSDFKELEEVKAAVEESKDELADRRARWVAANWQPGLPTASLVLLAGFLSPAVRTSSGFDTAIASPGALGMMLAALSSISYTSQVSLEDLKPASPFGDQADPDRRGLNDRQQDGADVDGGGPPAPAPLFPGAGAAPLPPDAVPAGAGYWGQLAKAVLGGLAAGAAVNELYKMASGGGASDPGAPGDPGDPGDDEKTGDDQEEKEDDDQETDDKKKDKDGKKRRERKERPRHGRSFTETPITVRSGAGGPPNNQDLRPEFIQVGADILDRTYTEQKRDELAFAAFNKVLPHFGDVSNMARASDARRFNNTIKAPQPPLTRRDVVEIMQTFLDPKLAGKLSQYGDPRALGQVADVRRNPDFEPQQDGVRPVYGVRPTTNELAFPYQMTDGLPAGETLPQAMYNDAPPVDNKRLPDVSVQSLQPAKSLFGYQDWYQSNTVVNPPEASMRSRFPVRARNVDTGARGYTFEDGRGWAIGQWPVPGTESGGPKLAPFVETSKPVTTLKETANPAEMSYDRSMAWQTGGPSVFKPLPMT